MLIGCEGTPNGDGGTSNASGAGSIALVLAGGAVVNTFTYSITGPNSYSGTINVANSSTVSADIGGIVAGDRLHAHADGELDRRPDQLRGHLGDVQS